MPVEYFIRYKGQCYDVGTKLKLNYFGKIIEGVIEEFIGTTVYIRFDNGILRSYSTIGTVNFDKLIVEIIHPVYYLEKQTKGNNRQYPPSWYVEIGWVWYIIIMVVGVIFEERWLIWIVASALFFLWKNGFMHDSKK